MFLRALIFLAATLFATHAFGWNDRGHTMVAAIAWDNLTEETQERVTELLKLNPEYRHWVSGVPRTDRDKVAFMKAATWPDFIKRADGYINDGEDPTDLTKAPEEYQVRDRLSFTRFLRLGIEDRIPDGTTFSGSPPSDANTSRNVSGEPR